MHPFWSSHEGIRDYVRLSMGGGHGQSWSFHGTHGELTGEGKLRDGGGGEGGTAMGRHGEVGHHGEVCYGGAVGGTMGLQPQFGLLFYVKTGSRKEKKRRRKERRKRKGRNIKE
jgi:hypothetical protein